jgi:hypothetical protein
MINGSWIIIWKRIEERHAGRKVNKDERLGEDEDEDEDEDRSGVGDMGWRY